MSRKSRSTVAAPSGPSLPARSPATPRRWRSAAWLALLGLGVALAGGAWWLRWRAAPAVALGPPNVVLVTLDTTRADRLGAYGYAPARTPTLDRLAREGVLFERAVAAAATTLPAHTSLFTARNPMSHGVRNNGEPLDTGVPTLASAFHDAGYRTGAFVSAFVLDRRFGLARGFDTYDDHLDPPLRRSADELERRGDRTVAAAVAWLASLAAAPAPAPFFLWVHLYDPHDPYDSHDAPAPHSDGTASANAYDGEIAFADAALATLLSAIEARGLTSRTLVTVIGDHGESLGEHGEVTHGMFVYDAVIHVPALMTWPGRVPSGVRVPSLVRAIDVAPTLLEWAGLPALAGATGASVVPLMRGAKTTIAPAYGETLFPQRFMNWAPLRSLRDGQWKFIEAPAVELYDLAADPGETSNLAAREPDRAARMRRALHTLLDVETSSKAAAAVDRDTLRKLAALGYVGGGGTGSADALARPDPKAMIGVFNALRGANTALEEGRLDEATRVASATLAQDRGNAFARLILGKAARERGQYAEAAEHFRAYLEQVPLSADAHQWLAICRLQLGDLDAALAEVELALAVDPRFAEARTLRGDLLAAAGRLEEGLHDLRSAVNLDPDRPAAHIALGRTLMRSGASADAVEQFDYAMTLARGLAAAGRVEQAALAFAQVAAEPSVPAATRDAARARLGRR